MRLIKASVSFVVLFFMACTPKPSNDPIVLEIIDEKAFESSQNLVSEEGFQEIGCSFKLLQELDSKSFYKMRSMRLLRLECDKQKDINLQFLRNLAREYTDKVVGSRIASNGPVDRIVMLKKFKYLDALQEFFYFMDLIVEGCEYEYRSFNNYGVSHCSYTRAFMSMDIEKMNDLDVAHKTLVLNYIGDKLASPTGEYYDEVLRKKYMSSWPMYKKRIEEVGKKMNPLKVVLSNLDQYTKQGNDVEKLDERFLLF